MVDMCFGGQWCFGDCVGVVFGYIQIVFFVVGVCVDFCGGIGVGVILFVECLLFWCVEYVCGQCCWVGCVVEFCIVFGIVGF